MTIQLTKQQVELFQQQHKDEYVVQLQHKLSEHFPHLAITLDQKAFINAIEQGIEKAQKRGFTQRGAVQLYINLLIVLGAGFELDPQYFKVAEILSSDPSLPQLVRAEKAFEHVKTYFDTVLGENEMHLSACATRLESMELDSLNVQQVTLEDDIRQLLATLYPEKYHNTEPEAMTALIAKSQIKAFQNYYFTHPQHTALIAVLMFLMGSDFDQDPFAPWIDRNKLTPFLRDSDVAAHKLESRAKIWLQAALKNRHEQQKREVKNKDENHV